jgi:hypothetical protein
MFGGIMQSCRKTEGGIVTRRQESFVKYRVLQRAWQRQEWGVCGGKGKKG